MYTPEQLQQGIQKATAAGDMEAAARFERALKLVSSTALAPTTSTDQPGFFENVGTGLGSGFTKSLETGALGVSTVLEEQAELKARDKIKGIASIFTPEGGDKDSVTYNLANAVGSTVGGIAATIGGGIVGSAAGPAGTLAGATLAGGALGVATQVGEASERAREAGVSEKERNDAITNPLVIGAGLLESIPYLKVVNKFNKGTASKLDKILGGDKELKGLLDRARSAGTTGGVEALQELAQNTAQNIVERGYNPDKELSEGSAESAGYGFGAGAILQLFIDVLPGKQRGKTPQQLQEEENKAQEEKDKVKKEADIDKNVEAARARRTDPQGDLFPVEAEEAERATQGPKKPEPKKSGRDAVEDEVRAEAKKREEDGAVEFTEEEIQSQVDDLYAKDDIKQRDLFGTPAKTLDEAVDPKMQKDKPKELPQPVLVGTPEGEVGKQQDIEAKEREKESVVGDKPSDKVVAASTERQASQAEQKARDTETDPRGDLFTAEKQAETRSAKQTGDVITKQTLDQMGIAKGAKIRKDIIGKPVSDPTVQEALSTVTVRDKAAQSRLDSLLTTPKDTTVSKKVLDDLGVPKGAPIRAEIQGEKLVDVQDTLLTYARKQGQKGLTTDTRNKIISFAEGAPIEQGTLDLRGRRNAPIPKDTVSDTTPASGESRTSIPSAPPTTGTRDAQSVAGRLSRLEAKGLGGVERGANTTNGRKRTRKTPVNTRRKTVDAARDKVKAQRVRTELATAFTEPFEKGTPIDPFTEKDNTALNRVKQTRGVENVTRANKRGLGAERSAKVYLNKYDNPSSALLAAIDESIRGKPPVQTEAETKLFEGTDKTKAKSFVKWAKKNLDPKTKEWIEKQEAAVNRGYVTAADEKRASYARDAKIEADRKDTSSEVKSEKKSKGLKYEAETEKQAKQEESDAETYAQQNQQVYDGAMEALAESDPDVAEAMVGLTQVLGIKNQADSSPDYIALQETIDDTVLDALKANDLQGAMAALVKTVKNSDLKKMAKKLAPIVGTTKVFVVDINADITDPVASAPIKYSRYRADEAKSGRAPFGTFLSTDVAMDVDLIDALGQEGADTLSNSIVLNPYFRDEGISVHVLLHELAHAGTLATLSNKSHPMTKQLDNIFEAVKDQISNRYAAIDLAEFVAEMKVDAGLRAELAEMAILNEDGANLLDTGPQMNALQRYWHVLRNWLRTLIGKKKDPFEIDYLIDQILAPEVGGYGPTSAYDKTVIEEKVGDVQRALNKQPMSETKIAVKEGWRKLWGSPKKVLDGAAWVAPSEMLADMADTTDPLLGKLAKNLHIQFQSMRGKMEQEMKVVGASVEQMVKWDNTLTDERRDAFNAVVHNSTLARVDPTKPASEYTGKQLEDWKSMRADWETLEQVDKDQYAKLRDSYKAQYLQLQDVIKGRVSALTKDNPALAKELENKVLSKLFDSANVEPYFPLTRVGDYKLGYSLKAEREGSEDAYVFKMFTSNTEREAWMAENVDNNPDVVPNTVELQFGDKPMKFSNLPPTSFVMQTANLLRNAKGVDEKVITQFMQSFVEVLPESALAKGFATRKGTAGFQENALLAFRLKAPQLARQIERMRGGVQIDAIRQELNEMVVPSQDRRGVGERVADASKDKGKRAALGEELVVPFNVIREELIKRAEFALYPPKGTMEELAQRANQLGFVYTIGWNASSAVVNMSQLPLFIMPYFTARFGAGTTTKAMGASLNLLHASGTVRDPLLATIGKYTKGMFGKNAKKYGKQRDMTGDLVDMHTMPSVDNYFVVDADGVMQVRDDFPWPKGKKGKELKAKVELLQPLVQEMATRGQLNSSFISDTMGVDYNSSVTSSGLRKVSDFVTKTSAFMFHHVEQYNRQATHIAAFLLEYNKLNTGKDTKDLTTAEKQQRATEYAMRESQRVNGGANLETTGRIGQQGIGRVAWMYKSYGTRMYATMLTSAKRTIDKHEDPEIREQAFKELVAVTGSSILFAGLRGFPLYGLFRLVYDTLFAGDEEDDFDTMVRKHVGEGWFKGAITAATGADVSSRIALSGLLLQVNRYNHDPSAEETLGFYLGGPAWSTGKRIGRGINDLARGEVSRGIESIVPGSITNVMKAQRYSDEGAKTRRYDDIMADVSGGQALAQLVGFAPAEYNMKQERNMATKRKDRTISKQAKDIKKKIYVSLRSSNLEALEDAYEEMEEFNAKHPEVRIKPEDISKSVKRHKETSKDMYDGITITSSLQKMLEEDREEWDQGFNLF